jgi:methylated-DNA-[protein]-cysteine S-methyltransferase
MKKPELHYFLTRLEGIGYLNIGATQTGICRISFGKQSANRFIRDCRDMFPGHSLIKRKRDLSLYIEALERYFSGKMTVLSFNVDWGRTVSLFTRMVLEVARKIPYGRVISYGDLAWLTGSESSARAIGNAMGKNPVPIIIPCHRVIASDGTLGGFTGGLSYKKKLLANEDIDFNASKKKPAVGKKFRSRLVADFSENIICRLHCQNGPPLPENLCFLNSVEEGRRLGLEPCRWCRPDLG